MPTRSKRKNCNICGKRDLSSVVDGKTIYGLWAWMCLDCYREQGAGLGLGKGQLFIQYGDGGLIKVAG